MFRRRKRNERQLTSIHAQMRKGDDWIPVTLANLSTHGVMVKSEDPPEIGTQVEIRHRGVAIYGIVAWSSSSRFGVKANEEIDMDALTAQSDVRVRSARIDAPIRDQKWWHWRKER